MAGFPSSMTFYYGSLSHPSFYKCPWQVPFYASFSVDYWPLLRSYQTFISNEGYANCSIKWYAWQCCQTKSNVGREALSREVAHLFFLYLYCELPFDLWKILFSRATKVNRSLWRDFSFNIKRSIKSLIGSSYKTSSKKIQGEN